MSYKKIFKKYLENRASPEEVKILRSWLNSADDDGEVLDFIEKEWQQFIRTDGDSLPEMDDILNRINHTIDRNENRRYEEGIRSQGTRRLVHRISVLGVAAAIGIVVVVAASVVLKEDRQVNSPPVRPVSEVKSNPRGQKSTLMLIDGTRVTLNSDSELSFPETFTADKRVVHLKGEAFFEVAKDASRPFTVVTDNVTTTALGTSFNVKAYEGQRNIEVILATGVVNVRNEDSMQNDNVILHPNHRAIFTKSTASFTRDSLDIQGAIAWKDGILMFKDAGLAEVKEKLERWYNVHFLIHHEEKWGERSITGKFDNESLENVLEGISYSSRFAYRLDGRQVIIDL